MFSDSVLFFPILKFIPKHIIFRSVIVCSRENSSVKSWFITMGKKRVTKPLAEDFGSESDSSMDDSGSDSDAEINQPATNEPEWPTGKAARAPEQLALSPADQKDFERFVKDKRAQIKNNVKTDEPGVVYLGHIPEGFAEKPLKEFFSQFGTIKRIKLSRSKKTGKSKGYGFIEFESGEVAKIAAESMNNYLMYEKLFKCQYLPPDQVHSDTFKNAHKRMRPSRQNAKQRFAHDKNVTDNKHGNRMKRLRKGLQKKQKNLEKLGITYQIPVAANDSK